MSRTHLRLGRSMTSSFPNAQRTLICRRLNSSRWFEPRTVLICCTMLRARTLCDFGLSQPSVDFIGIS